LNWVRWLTQKKHKIYLSLEILEGFLVERKGGEQQSDSRITQLDCLPITLAEIDHDKPCGGYDDDFLGWMYFSEWPVQREYHHP